MATKKSIVNLVNQNITMSLQNIEYKLLSFNPSKMTLSITPVEDDVEGLSEIPFAHIPKELKKRIKPN